MYRVIGVRDTGPQINYATKLPYNYMILHIITEEIIGEKYQKHIGLTVVDRKFPKSTQLYEVKDWYELLGHKIDFEYDSVKGNIKGIHILDTKEEAEEALNKIKDTLQCPEV